MPPMSAEQCRQRAEEFESAAKVTRTPHIRESMLYLASRWRILADEEEERERRNKML